MLPKADPWSRPEAYLMPRHVCNLFLVSLQPALRHELLGIFTKTFCVKVHHIRIQDHLISPGKISPSDRRTTFGDIPREPRAGRWRYTHALFNAGAQIWQLHRTIVSDWEGKVSGGESVLDLVHELLVYSWGFEHVVENTADHVASCITASPDHRPHIDNHILHVEVDLVASVVDNFHQPREVIVSQRLRACCDR